MRCYTICLGYVKLAKHNRYCVTNCACACAWRACAQLSLPGLIRVFMNEIVLYRNIIDACCFIIGYLDKLKFDEKASGQIKDLLSTVCSIADSFEREEIDKLFGNKSSE